MSLTPFAHKTLKKCAANIFIKKIIFTALCSQRVA